MKKPKALPKSTSPRIDIMCGPGSESDSLEDLRFRREIAARDGDLKLALRCSIAIDKLRFPRALRAQPRERL